jgi:hypothetical protein
MTCAVKTSVPAGMADDGYGIPRPTGKTALMLPVEIDRKRLQDILISAFDGGSNYWIGRLKVEGGATMSRYVAPFTGGRVTVYTAEKADQGYVKHSRTEASLLLGLVECAKSSPKHYADFLTGRDDATTADVILQYAVLGEVIYG